MSQNDVDVDRVDRANHVFASGSDMTATGNRQWLGGTAFWTGLLILTMMVWGNSFIAIKYVVAYVRPLELVTVRFAGGANLCPVAAAHAGKAGLAPGFNCSLTRTFGRIRPYP